MNIKYILFHLKDAKEELDKTIDYINKNKDYSNEEFLIAMSHLYNHLNTSWHIRNASVKEIEECSQENFDKWRKFPKDEELLLDDE